MGPSLDRGPDGHCYKSDPLRFSAYSLAGLALLITDEFFNDLPPGSRCCPPTAEFVSVPPFRYCGTGDEGTHAVTPLGECPC